MRTNCLDEDRRQTMYLGMLGDTEVGICVRGQQHDTGWVHVRLSE